MMYVRYVSHSNELINNPIKKYLFDYVSTDNSVLLSIKHGVKGNKW